MCVYTFERTHSLIHTHTHTTFLDLISKSVTECTGLGTKRDKNIGEGRIESI